MIRLTILVLAVLAVAATGWIVFGPGKDPGTSSPGPDGEGESTESPGETHPDSSPPPPPGAEVTTLLRHRDEKPESVRKELGDLAGTEKGVREILAAIRVSKSPAERALLYLHLVRGGTKTGLAKTRDAATGDGRKEDRIPAIYALAGGETADGDRIGRVLATAGDDDLVRAAAFALSLRGDDVALHHLETYLARESSGPRRMLVYESFTDGPLRPAEEFFPLLPETAAGRRVVDRERPGYLSLIEQISREESPEAFAPAARVLLWVQGAEAQRGVRDIWERAPEDDRRDLARAVFEAITMDQPGSGRTLVTVARGLDEQAEPEMRDRVRAKLQEWRDRESLPDLEKWRDATEDPELRQDIDATIDRVRAEAADEPR